MPRNLGSNGALVGTLGTRFDLSQDDNALGLIEVCQLSGEVARSSTSRGWVDVGNLVVEDGVDPDTVVPHLYSVGAEWLLLGGIKTLIDYHSEEDPEDHRLLLQEVRVQDVGDQRPWLDDRQPLDRPHRETLDETIEEAVEHKGDGHGDQDHGPRSDCQKNTSPLISSVGTPVAIVFTADDLLNARA